MKKQKFPVKLWYDEDSVSPKVYEKPCFSGHLRFSQQVSGDTALYNDQSSPKTTIVYRSNGTLYKYEYKYYTYIACVLAAKDVQDEINLNKR